MQPVPSGYEPGSHEVQLERPGPALNVPPSQSMQASTPPTEYVPMRQSEQVLSAEFAYLPGPQYKHELRTSPAETSLLTQPSVWSHVEQAVAPGLLNSPSGQPLQEGGDEELSRNSPPEQRVHDTEPEAVLKEPVGHGEHEVELTVAEKFPWAH